MDAIGIILMAIGLVFVAAICAIVRHHAERASDRPRAASFGRAERLDRRARHYFASGALPRWD